MGTEPRELVRRRFLSWISGAGAFFAAHGFEVSQELNAGPQRESKEATQTRIHSLELLTAAPLPQMKQFYHQLLGLSVVHEDSGRLTIEAGETRITFLKVPAELKEPFYHFAFNIPENKILAARQWQLERTPLLPIPKYLRDKMYPDDVVDYRHWNAHSVFFFDPAGNVLEYIARHDLENAATGDFSSQDILCASEIAFVVDDVLESASKLKEVAGVGQYKKASKQFAAVGDELGLLLVMKRGRIISFSAPEKKAVGVHSTKAEIVGAQIFKYAFPKLPYELSVKT